MSAPSIAPFLPFRRVRIEGHRVEAEPAFAVVDLEPDRRYVSRCGRCGGQSRRVHSCYRRRVWDLSLEAHRVRLRLRVRRLRCASCAGVRSEGFDFVDPFVPASPGGWPATSATLGACFELMSEEERAAVEAVALDMWYPYIQAVRAWLPNARVVYGLYHVVADYHRRVLDRVRVAAYKEAETEEERRWIAA